MKQYNTTQLYPDQTFERHIFHRDQFAHYLRWSHVLKEIKRGQVVMDVGCGSGNLCEVLYRNRFAPEQYLGVDIRRNVIRDNASKFSNCDWAFWKCHDVVLELPYTVDKNFHWDLICSFEMLEHVGKENGRKVLDNIRKCCDQGTIVMLSSPVYDEEVGPAENHIINGEVGEYTFEEMRDMILAAGFNILQTFGTFASIRDYNDFIGATGNENYYWVYNRLRKYYDVNLVAVIMAPIIPAHMCRNVLWEIKI